MAIKYVKYVNYGLVLQGEANSSGVVHWT